MEKENNQLENANTELVGGAWYLAEGNCPHCFEFMAIIDCSTIKFCPYCGEDMSIDVDSRKRYLLSEENDFEE